LFCGCPPETESLFDLKVWHGWLLVQVVVRHEVALQTLDILCCGASIGCRPIGILPLPSVN
jgi:hypothetical protein